MEYFVKCLLFIVFAMVLSILSIFLFNIFKEPIILIISGMVMQNVFTYIWKILNL